MSSYLIFKFADSHNKHPWTLKYQSDRGHALKAIGKEKFQARSNYGMSAIYVEGRDFNYRAHTPGNSFLWFLTPELNTEQW